MAISPQRLTIYLYSAHRAVIFAIAQLSCYFYFGCILFFIFISFKLFLFFNIAFSLYNLWLSSWSINALLILLFPKSNLFGALNNSGKMAEDCIYLNTIKCGLSQTLSTFWHRKCHISILGQKFGQSNELNIAYRYRLNTYRTDVHLLRVDKRNAL